MIRWQQVKRLLPLAGLLALLLSGCAPEPGPLDPVGGVAEEQYNLIKLSIAIMSIVVVVVFVLTAFVLVRFRKRPGDNKIPKQVEGNHTLEVIWTVIPIILLIILAVPTLKTTFSQAKDYSNDPDVLQVKVTAHQYWWEFEYPDLGVYTAQDLVVPENSRVFFKLTSRDVTHSFWIPAIGGKIDTNPGLINTFYLDMPGPGVYKGKCAELCGQSHALMDFKVVVKTENEFTDWVANMKTETAIPAEAQLGEEIFKAKCIVCHAVSGENKSSYPNLKGFANRENLAGFVEMTPENIKEWLADPIKMKPGNLMPNLSLSNEEIDELTKYLLNLK